MKRKLGIVLTVLLVVAIAAASLVGCNKTDKNNNNSTPIKVTINWNLQGAADTVAEVDANGSINVGNLQLPTNEGFHVGGFYLDAACTQPVDLAALAATADVTVYAKWVEDQAGQPAVLTGLQLRYLGGDKQIGESISASEVEVVAQFSDSTVLRIREGFVVGEFDSSTAGAKTVEVSYTLEGITVRSTITVNVVEAEPQGHVHSMTRVARQDPTATEDGHLEYWACSGCNKYFEDEAGTREIADLAAWLAGDGKLPATGSGEDPTQHTHHLVLVARQDPTATEDGHVEYWVCSSCYKAFEDEAGTREITDYEAWIQGAGRLPATGGGDNPPTGTYDVYFFNADGWDEVFAHVWENEGAALNEWPGDAMNALPDHAGWYKATFTLNGNRIIFNGGVGAAQSATEEIDLDKLFFKSGVWYATMEEADEAEGPEQPSGTIEIIALNELCDGALFLHYWNNEGLSSEWPGIEMQPIEGKDNWFKADIPAGATALKFTDGAKENTAESAEFAIDSANRFFWRGAWHDDFPGNEPQPDMLTIIVLDEFGWDALNVHYWNNEGISSEWPGVALEPLADRQGWYSAQVDARATMLQFNNGIGINEGGQQSNEFALDADNLYFWRSAWHNAFPEEPGKVIYTLASGDNVVTMEPNEDPTVGEQVSGQLHLEIGDVVTISDNQGNVYSNWEDGCNFNGTAEAKGTYTFYLKLFDNFDIWVNFVADVG
ncbi:MAG: starch-binding protein, partial [Clostridia bacterium]|nr:starch-binding protein [Clostridia bacterium]